MSETVKIEAIPDLDQLGGRPTGNYKIAAILCEVDDSGKEAILSFLDRFEVKLEAKAKLDNTSEHRTT